MLVTRQPLLPGLVRQVSAQLGVVLTPDNGVHRGHLARRTIVVVSWTRLLRSVTSGKGEAYAELLALDAAIEGITDFEPFTAVVQDRATGQMVSQVTEVAHRLCALLPERLTAAQVRLGADPR